MSKIELKNKSTIFILTFIVFSLFVSTYYIKDGTTMGKDAGATFIGFSNNIARNYFLWADITNGGSNYYGIFTIFPHLLGAIFGYTLSAFMYYSFIYSAGFIGCYLFMRKFLRCMLNTDTNIVELASFMGTLFYFLNPISVSYRLGDTLLGSTMFYIIFPLVLYVFMNYFNDPKFIYILIMLFIAVGLGFMDIFRWVLSLSFLLFYILACYLYFGKQELNTKKILHSIRMSIIIVLIFSPVIIGIFTTAGQTMNAAFGYIDPISNLLFSKTLIEEWQPVLVYPSLLWNGLYSYNNFYLQPFIMAFWIFIMAFTFFSPILFKILYKCDDEKRLFDVYIITITMFIIVTIVAMIPKGPLGDIFQFLFIKIRLLQILRTPYDKFNTLVTFFGSILFSISIIVLLRNRLKIPIMSKVIFFIIVIFMIMMSLPVLTGKIAYNKDGSSSKFNSSQSLKEDLKILANFSTNSKMLFYPPIDDIWIYSNFGYYGEDYMDNVLNGNHITYRFGDNDLTERIYLISNKDNINDEDCEDMINVLHVLKVTHIVFRKDLNHSVKQYKKAYRNFPSVRKCVNIKLEKKLNYFDIYNFSNDSQIFSADSTSTIVDKEIKGKFIDLNVNSVRSMPDVLKNYAIPISLNECKKNCSLMIRTSPYAHIDLKIDDQILIDKNYKTFKNIDLNNNFKIGVNDWSNQYFQGTMRNTTIKVDSNIYNKPYFNFTGNNFDKIIINESNASDIEYNSSVTFFNNTRLHLGFMPERLEFTWWNDNTIWVSVYNDKLQRFFSMYDKKLLHPFNIKLSYHYTPNTVIKITTDENTYFQEINLTEKIIEIPIHTEGRRILVSSDTNIPLESIILTSKEITEKNRFDIDIDKVNPTFYKIKINTSKPFILSFAENYDPSWTAMVYKINGIRNENYQKISPIELYNSINGFLIDDTGNLDIIVEYSPQRWLNIGMIISMTSLIIYTGIYFWRR